MESKRPSNKQNNTDPIPVREEEKGRRSNREFPRVLRVASRCVREVEK